jgi:hypothetical protein
MKKIHISLLMFVVFFAFSCAPKNEEQTVFTTQIQYDVVLKNPDSTSMYPHRFMDDSTRFLFLKKIIDPILAGEITAYVWKNSRLVPASVPEFKNRFVLDKSKSIQDSLNPGNSRVDLNEVTKIRYFEEWRLKGKSLVIDKRIFAISLIRDSYTFDGEYRGTEPLFYIFYDKAFIDKFKQIYFQ